MLNDINEKRPVNKMLGEQPSMGPIPGDQVVPWSMIAGICLGLKVILSLPWLYTGLLLVWGIATWWLLTGKKAWKFLSRFHTRPRWIRSCRPYVSPFNMGQDDELKLSKKSKKRR